MFNPLFDPSTLTDRELQKKIEEQTMRISSARSAGISDDIIAAMYGVLQSCEDELSLRYGSRQAEKMQDEDPCVFDMNSYLSDENEDKKTNESSRKQIYKSGW